MLAVSGCATMRLAYNSSDKLIAYRMNDWLDLSGELEGAARERIDRLIAWHRRDELPEYSRMLLSVRERLEDPAPLTVPQVLAIEGRVTQRLLRTGGRVADEFADLFPRLGPPQRERLLKQAAKSNAEFREKNIDLAPERLRKQRIDDTVERYEFWMGRLDAAQRERVARWADENEAAGEVRLKQRQSRQQAFLAIMDAGKTAPPAETANRLRSFFADIESPRDAAAKERQRVQLQGWATMTVDVLNSASPEQKKRMRDKIQSMSNDFLVLSRQ